MKTMKSWTEKIEELRRQHTRAFEKKDWKKLQSIGGRVVKLLNQINPIGQGAPPAPLAVPALAAQDATALLQKVEEQEPGVMFRLYLLNHKRFVYTEEGWKRWDYADPKNVRHFSRNEALNFIGLTKLDIKYFVIEKVEL